MLKVSIKLKKNNLVVILIILFFTSLKSNQIIFEKKQLPTNQFSNYLSEFGNEGEDLKVWNEIFFDKSLEDIKIFMNYLPSKSSSSVIQDIVFKFLSSKKKLSRNVVDLDDDQEIFELYIKKLFETGRINEIELFYSQSPDLKDNEFILKKMIEGNLLRNRHKEACKILRNKTNYTPDVFGKVIIICDILNSKFDEAKLGLSLLKEQNKPGDIFFIDLAYSLMSEENISESDSLKKNLEEIKTLNPIIMSSLQFADISPSYEQIENLDTSGLLFILSNPSVDTDLKIFCSEILVKQGRIGIDMLSEAYQLSRFKNRDIENALKLYKTLSPAKARPLLYQSILREKDNENKSKKIIALLKISENDNLLKAVSKLVSDLLPKNFENFKKDDALITSKMYQSIQNFFMAESVLDVVEELENDTEILFQSISISVCKFINGESINMRELENKLEKIKDKGKIDFEKFNKIIMVMILNFDFSQKIKNILSSSEFLIAEKNPANLQSLFLANSFSTQNDLFNSLIIFFKITSENDFEDLNLIENYQVLMILKNLGFKKELKELSESILL